MLYYRYFRVNGIFKVDFMLDYIWKTFFGMIYIWKIFLVIIDTVFNFKVGQKISNVSRKNCFVQVIVRKHLQKVNHFIKLQHSTILSINVNYQ